MEIIKTIINKWRNLILARGIKLLALLKPSLKPEQLSSLQAKFAERTDEIKEVLNLNAEEYLEARKEKILENFETFYGPADEQQQTRLFLIYGLDRSRDEARLKNRGYFNEFFLKTLNAPDDPAKMTKKFSQWVADPSIAIPQEKRDAYLRLVENWYQRLIETDKLITKEQRNHLVNYISKLKEDLLKQALPSSECKV